MKVRVLDWMKPVREQVQALVVLALEDGLSDDVRAERLERVNAALEEFQEGPPQTEPSFPEPFVRKPALGQLVKGARVEYEARPGEVLVGWVHEAGMLPTRYRGLTEPESAVPRAAVVMVDANRPGARAVVFLAPSFVPLEDVRRASCAPDPDPEMCWRCGQSGEAKSGEAPCRTCHRPTEHDVVQEPVVSMSQRVVAAWQAGDIKAMNGAAGFRSLTPAGAKLLQDMTPEELSTGAAAWAIREGHRRIAADETPMEASRAKLEEALNRDAAPVAKELGMTRPAGGPEAFTHGGTYISKTDCNRWITGTQHLKGTPGQEIYGRLRVSREDRKKIDCPECLKADA